MARGNWPQQSPQRYVIIVSLKQATHPSVLAVQQNCTFHDIQVRCNWVRQPWSPQLYLRFVIAQQPITMSAPETLTLAIPD